MDLGKTFVIPICICISLMVTWVQADDSDDNYIIQNDILIKTRDGARISAIKVTAKSLDKPTTTILQFTVYVRDTGRDLNDLKKLANRGFVAVIAYSRGKRHSSGEILPYEHDANDAHDVIDWISKQPWSNGEVGMYGGSYNGFTQWAAAKDLHPALKTIVPYVASRPGMGLPMENNIFINPNYEWSFYVGSNRYLNEEVGNDRARFRRMQNQWWESGAQYKTLDSIDGTPNPLFQRWISHPAFDKYWQDMSPYEHAFADINIPVLSIDGYYNDSQNSGLYYLREHYKYSPDAEHYLVIGPYSHFGAQRNGAEVINSYTVDSNALIDTAEITYQWFDYIFNNADKPEILKDKINYQVMGADQWRSAPSIDAMSNQTLKLYLSNETHDGFYSLNSDQQDNLEHFYQEVDFSNRDITNNDYYPDPIIRSELDMINGFAFVSQPFEQAVLVNGSFSGEIRASINKYDMDIGVTLYELMPNGQFFHLSYFVGRASFAKDISKRNLLQPNQIETIPFTNTHLVSKQLEKDSRLLVVLNVNKNPFSQLNYGTGKEVSSESILDAGEPLKVKWFNDSFVKIPLLVPDK
jgi:putative CocE/NonD family hydrolase